MFVRLFFILTSFFFTSSLYAQTVRKVKIDELESYIRNADHPLVVSFWATWCGPCVREIPWIQSAVEKQKDKGVELLLVSLDFPDFYPKKLAAFIIEKKFAGTYFWLNETNADIFCPRIDAKWEGGIPANLFINNKTGYRKFFQRQITDRQAEQEVLLLVK